METAALDYDLNTDFERLVNPTGRFVVGSSFADSGLTGRKIIADTYGGMCRHGGGAFSGKDPTKVDRSGAYMARKIARDIVVAKWAEQCEVQLAYAIGVAEPVSIAVDCFGTNLLPEREIVERIRTRYDLTPDGIINSLHLLDVDYNLVSAYGHFGKLGLPWEE
jgi:S-adenosylmethionine synthetase